MTLRLCFVRARAYAGDSAVAHSMLTAAWHILQTGEIYSDPGGDYYGRRDPARTTRRLIDQLERLGHTVTLEPAPTSACTGISLQKVGHFLRPGRTAVVLRRATARRGVQRAGYGPDG